MLTWTQVVTDDFNRANTSVNSTPGSTTGVGGPSGTASWIDNAGGTWSIQSNTLSGTTSNPNAYMSGFLVRPTTENQVDQRIVATFVATGNNQGVVFRVRANGDHYGVMIEPDGIYLTKVLSNVSSVIGSKASYGLFIGSTYTLDAAVTGSTPTTFTVTLSNSAGVVAQFSTPPTDSSATVQIAGQSGVILYAATNGPSVTQTFSSITTYQDQTATSSGSGTGSSGLPGAFGAFQGKIATTGTPVSLAASPTLVSGVLITALPTNKAPLLIGGSGVTNGYDGTGTGYPIGPTMAAMSVSLGINQADLVYINGVAGDGWSRIYI